MDYTEHQLAVLEVIGELIKHGATEIEIAEHVFGFVPITVKANQIKTNNSIQPTQKTGR